MLWRLIISWFKLLVNLKILNNFFFLWFNLRFIFVTNVLFPPFLLNLNFRSFNFLFFFIIFWSTIIFNLQWALLIFSLNILICFLSLSIFWLYILRNRSHLKLDKSSPFYFSTLLINLLHPLDISLNIFTCMSSLLVIVRAVFKNGLLQISFVFKALL